MSLEKTWSKGRGKLGFLSPLIGSWVADVKVKGNQFKCTRTFTWVLDKKFVQLAALWELDSGHYEEIALYGTDAEGKQVFWSFTSDGKQAQGWKSDASDVHPQAVAFEAQMPAGLARMVYWPDDSGGFYWAVESGTKKGWNRFQEHHYKPA